MEVKIFSFGRGAFFGGSLRTSIYMLPDDTRNVLVRIDPYNYFYIIKMPAHKFLMPVDELRKITAFLDTIRNWKEEYKCKDKILDGYGWHIEYHSDVFEYLSHGYESYPENYREKISELQTIKEDLCLKYAPDRYDWEGREDRIKL